MRIMRLLILYFKRKITGWTHEDQNPSFLALKMQKSAILAFCSQTAARPSLDLNVAAFDALFHNDPIAGVKSPSSPNPKLVFSVEAHAEVKVQPYLPQGLVLPEAGPSTNYIGLGPGEEDTDIDDVISEVDEQDNNKKSTWHFNAKVCNRPILLTGFNEQAEKLASILELNESYQISKAIVKPAAPLFNKTSHPYELIASQKTQIERVSKNKVNLPDVTHNFAAFEDINNNLIPQNTIVHVEGTVTEVFSASSGINTYQKPYERRAVTLTDYADNKLNLILWNANVNIIQKEHIGRRVKIFDTKISLFQEAVYVNASNSRMEIDY
ncbi:unnamed protein product [Bemisia tabaci]|uniref:Replication protein A OB domain-containing protein n=1 Tax=Bemisia tabaci TaxID=7038 RepID=A0A9N9ZYM1_BEMTA|nr:unnamed protein product [Bemisia tabaci]